MPLYLVSNDYPETPVALDKPIVLFGRQAECDVILTCSRKVSRRHCCVIQIAEWFIVRDLGSTNGVSVNGERILRESRLNVGDELSIGDVLFELTNDTLDAPKGKVCIGPPLKSGQKKKSSESNKDRRKEFRGIPAQRSKPRKKDNPPPRTGEPSRSRSQKRRPEKPGREREIEPIVDDDEMLSDTFGSDQEFNDAAIDETFGSDKDFDEMRVDETFDSNVVGTPPIEEFDENEPLDDDHFAFLDDDDGDDADSDGADEPQQRIEQPKRKRPQPYRPERSPLPSSGELDEFDDDAFESDIEQQIVERKPKRRRKPKAADSRLREDERLNNEDVDVRRTGGGGAKEMDSIIELDEFDLLD